MDYRAGVTAHEGSTETYCAGKVQADQAIFTSIRTPMGEGYRLVAASPAITSEERAEITRRSPSHCSLCDPDPAAQGLSTYPLSTARQCVAWTRYAGREHTARGGQRVHTHLVILEPADFVAFDCDPFRVYAALRDVIGDAPDVKPATSLHCLTLSPCGRNGFASNAGPADVENACRVAGHLIGREAVLALGAADPLELLRWTVAILPRAFRVGLAATANLQYASSRQMHLTCAGKNGPDRQRAVQGQSVFVLDLANAAQPDDSPCSAWFNLVLERARAGRLAETIAVADQLDGTPDAQTLARVAATCRDADQVEHASQAALEELVSRYGGVQPANPTEVRLIRQLLSAAVRRSATLQHPAAAGVPVPPATCRR